MTGFANFQARLAMALIATASVAGCRGEHQAAGRKADEAAATASGMTLVGAGPQERLGAYHDKVDQAARKAQAAEAKALEKRAKLTRDEAENQAEQMEQQAREIRNQLAKGHAPASHVDRDAGGS